MTDAARAKAWEWFEDFENTESADRLADLLDAYAAEQTAALRVALESEHRSVVMYDGLPDPDGAWQVHTTKPCSVCALLATATTP